MGAIEGGWGEEFPEGKVQGVAGVPGAPRLLRCLSAQAMVTQPCAQMPAASSAFFMHWWGSHCSGSCLQESGIAWAPRCAVELVTSKQSFW